MTKIAAIVLAAGKGTRMKSKRQNKVSLPVGGKPLVLRTVEALKTAKLQPIVVVVGFAASSVKKALGTKTVLYCWQRQQLGTAHAVSAGLKKIPATIANILIVNGDDSYLLDQSLIAELFRKHLQTAADLTLLTLKVDQPIGLGRIIRGRDGAVRAIVEEKNATVKERQIKEINPQCWVFKRQFLEEFLPKIAKNKISGEYYLTDLVELALVHNRNLQTVTKEGLFWRGVNTPAELETAANYFSKL